MAFSADVSDLFRKSHQASSLLRLSFAIDTEFYHNQFNSRLYDNTICSVPLGTWRRQ